jgi:hypothetical protein
VALLVGGQLLGGLRRELRNTAHQFLHALSPYFRIIRVTSVRRDTRTQSRLWDRYVSGQSIYPAAPPGHSPHECGIAFDVQLDPPNYVLAGEVWEGIGLRWGGRFDDEIHFDFLPTGYIPTDTPCADYDAA